MLTKTISLVVLTASLLLVCSSVAVAQRRAGQMPGLKRALALTDTQVSDIGVLFKKHREAAFPIRQDLRARNNELRNALEMAEPNATTVGQLVIARNELRKQLRELSIKLRSDIAALLTPEQKAKFEQMGGRRGPRRGRL
jgi:Spy/CpxP family protein refolding chaperone